MKRKVLRKVLAVALSAAMLAGTGFTTAGQFVGTDISVSASEVYGDFEYYEVYGDNTFAITGYTGNGGDVTIPGEIDGKIVTSINDSAFEGCTGLTSITLPDSVTRIDWGAFEGCTGLTSITIPGSVTSIQDYAFYGCTGLTSITIPDSVTYIGDTAFECCESLTYINVDKNNPVYSSDNGVILNKNKARVFFCPRGKTGEYVIPDDVTTIDAYAFSSCTGLTSVTIPDNVTFIVDFAFVGCTGLTSVTIPDSVTSIEDYTFKGCTGLTSITIPDSVTDIKDRAFYGCTGLTSITIPGSVRYIEREAFGNCDNLTIYGKKGSYAEEYANENDIPFVHIEAEASRYGIVGSMTGWGEKPDIPMYETETGIYVGKTDPLGAGDYEFKVRADSAWDDNWGVYEEDDDITYDSETNIMVTIEPPLQKDVIIAVKFDTTGDDYTLWPLSYAILTDANEEPDWIYTGKEDDDYDDDDDDSESKFGDFKYSVYDDRIQITGYTGNGGNVVIPDEIDGKSVTSIGDYAFNYRTGLKSVVIPNSVTYIGGDAFYYCISLKSVVIPSSVTYIGCSAFNGCTSLTSVVIPGNVTEIDDSAFENCESLTSVTIENGVQKIGWWAFEDCTSLTSIVIPGSVTEIEIGAFERCTSLTSVTIENGVQTIDPCAFEDCTSLTSVTIPSSVTEIDSSVFGGCKELTIYGIKDSYAEDYAKANHIPFVSAVHEGEISLGEPVMIRASLICGSGDYKYAVLYKKKSDTKWVTRQNFSENDIVSLTLSDVGEYDICVKVKDSFGNIQKRFFTVTVIIPKLINQSVISKTEINIGSTVTATGMAEGGTGDYTYAVYYKKKTDSKWTTKQNYSTNDTVKIKPAKVADYDVCVKVKDSQGTIVKKYFTVTVNDNELNNTSIISSQTIKKGSTVTLNGFATGGAGDYTYAVLYKQKSQSKWTTKQNFNENSVVSVKPAQATDYDICIKVKDKDGTIVKKYFTVTVK